MSDISLTTSAGTTPVTEALVEMHLTGAWVCDVAGTDPLDPDLAPGQAITVSLSALQLQGTVLRGGNWVNGEYARIVGGAGGLQKLAPAGGLTGPTAQFVVERLLKAAGEKLSSTANQAILAAVLPFWLVRGEYTATALGRVVNYLDAHSDSGCTWRVLADGTIYVGPEFWPAADQSDPALTLMKVAPARAEQLLMVSLTPDADTPNAVPVIVPGQTVTFPEFGIDAAHVSSVEIHIGPGAKWRTKLFIVDP